LANIPRLRQVRFGDFFCLICYYLWAETTTVVLLALILYKIKFSVAGFVHNRVLAGFWAIFATFSAHAQKRP